MNDTTTGPKGSLTKEQAIKLFESKFWEPLTYRERAVFQMHEDCLCMPMDVFQEAIENAVGRPVWTHELAFNYDGLLKELMEGGPSPTPEEILNMIPADKRIVIVV